MNRYPAWKYILLTVVILVGAVYALPNLYGNDPSLQVSGTRNAVVDESVSNTVSESLERAGIPVKATSLEDDKILVRFDGTDEQLLAADYVSAALGDNYVVAFNLAPATPDWLAAFNALPMYLGLDLRGGVHFLMEVDMQAAAKRAIERAFAPEFRNRLDAWVLFGGLTREVILKVVDKEVALLQELLEEYFRAARA